MGGDGHARIAGLGTAFIPSTVPAVDVDRSFQGTFAGLINARLLPDITGASMADDVRAFSILAWEVRMKIVASLDKPLNRIGSWTGFRWEISILPRVGYRRSLFNGEWTSTDST